MAKWSRVVVAGALLGAPLLLLTHLAVQVLVGTGGEVALLQPPKLKAAGVKHVKTAGQWNAGVLAGTASWVKECAHGNNAACDKLIADPGVVNELKKVNKADEKQAGWFSWAGFKGKKQMLWENYFPGYRAVRARYERTKQLLKAQDKKHEAMGLPKKTKAQEQKSIANPYVFCKKNFPPQSLYDQAEFRSCQEALGLDKVIDLQNVGDSQVATDITGAPAGQHQPDGPGSLSPGSDGWSRW